jgi:hypothetical protein
MNLLPVSFGWALGFYRLARLGTKELASGLKGAATFNKFGNASDLLGSNARWLVAYPMTMALTGAIYQYMKTGQAPGQYSDGGTTPGEPGSLIRILHNLAYPAGKILPGYDKDFTKWALPLFQPGPLIDKARNALATAYGSFVNDPMINIAHDLATGRDWASRNISHMLKAANGGKDVSLLSHLWHIFESNANPIALSNIEGAKKSPTPLTTGERIAGLRDAPKAVNDPAGYAEMMQKVENRDVQMLARQMLSEQKNLENPDQDLIAQLQTTLAGLKTGKGGSHHGSIYDFPHAGRGSELTGRDLTGGYGASFYDRPKRERGSSLSGRGLTGGYGAAFYSQAGGRSTTGQAGGRATTSRVPRQAGARGSTASARGGRTGRGGRGYTAHRYYRG